MEKIVETLAHHALHEVGHHVVKSSQKTHYTSADEKEVAVSQWKVKNPFDDVVSIYSGYTRKTSFFLELSYDTSEYWLTRIDPITKSIFCHKLSVRQCHIDLPSGKGEIHIPSHLLHGLDAKTASNTLLERDSRYGIIGTKTMTLGEVVMLAICNGNVSSFQLDNVGSLAKPLYRMRDKKATVWDSSRKEWYQTMSLAKAPVKICCTCLGNVKVLVDS